MPRAYQQGKHIGWVTFRDPNQSYLCDQCDNKFGFVVHLFLFDIIGIC